MGEFVEQSLESLLPTFEQLSHVQLFTESEVNAFVKRCRQFEYRLNKQVSGVILLSLFLGYSAFLFLRYRKNRLETSICMLNICVIF